MPRIRTVKPEFWSDTKMVVLGDTTRLVYLCLISMADDEGRIEATLKRVCAFGGWVDDRQTKAVENSLCELEILKRIVRYEIEGNHYIAIPKFRKHQVINRASESQIPDFTGINVKFTEHSVKAHGRLSAGMEGNGNGMDQGMEYCGEPPAGDSSAAVATDEEKAPDLVVLRFPITGNAREREWPLLQSKLDEYTEAFPGVDVLAEMRKARQWCVDNRPKRKTAKGMPGFLGRWLGKAVDSGRVASSANGKPEKDWSKGGGW